MFQSWAMYYDQYNIEERMNMIHSRRVFPGITPNPVSPFLYYHQFGLNHAQSGGNSIGFWPSNFFPEDETLILDEVGRERVNFNPPALTLTINEVGLMGRDHRRNISLSEETIARHLKTRTYGATADSRSKVEEDSKCCVICQIEYGGGETIGALECGHEYHANCIRRWLLEKNACPLCRRKAIHQEAIQRKL